MAVDQFIKLTKIPGEAQDDKHADEIDVIAWSWGLSNGGTTHIGGGSGAGKVNVQDLSFTKWVDKASPKLLMASTTGEHIDEAVLTVRKAGKNPLEYIVITMEQCLVTSVSTGGSSGEDRLTENVSLNFAKVKFHYKMQNVDGTGKAVVKYGWDIPKHKEIV